LAATLHKRCAPDAEVSITTRRRCNHFGTASCVTTTHQSKREVPFPTRARNWRWI